MSLPRIRPLVLLAALPTLANSALALDNPSFLPTAVFENGWPDSPATPGVEVQELAAVRFKDGLESDFAVLFDDGRLFLGYRPGRYRTYFGLGNGVVTMGALDLGDGTDGLLVVDGNGLQLRTWSPGPSGYHVDATLDATWTGVTRLWTYADGAATLIFGLDESAGVMRRHRLGGPNPGPLTSLLAPQGLVDFAPLQYDANMPGIELAWLYPDVLKVTDAEQTTLMANLPAREGDLIASIPAVAAQSEDFLVWCSSLDEAGPYQVVAWSANLIGFTPFALSGGRPSSILVYDHSGDGMADLALPSIANGRVEILEHSSWGEFTHPLDGAFLDTSALGMPESSAGPLSVACPYDIDQDEDLDLLVTRAGSASLHTQLSLVLEEDMQRLKMYKLFDITGEFGNGPVTLTLPLFANVVMSNDYEVIVWVEDTLGQGMSLQPSFHERVSASFSFGTATDLVMQLDEDELDHNQPGIVYWIYVAAVDLGSIPPGGQAGDAEIIRRYPTRLISWEPWTGGSPSGPTSGSRVEVSRSERWRRRRCHGPASRWEHRQQRWWRSAALILTIHFALDWRRCIQPPRVSARSKAPASEPMSTPRPGRVRAIAGRCRGCSSGPST